MPAVPLPSEIEAFVAQPHFAVVASLNGKGAPHTAVSWYDWQDGRVLVNMDATRARLRHLERDPRVALTIVDRDDWYRHVSLIGHVDERYDDDGLADIDRLALRYTGRPYPTREGRRVSAWIALERWHGWDASAGKEGTHAAWTPGADDRESGA